MIVIEYPSVISCLRLEKLLSKPLQANQCEHAIEDRGRTGSFLLHHTRGTDSMINPILELTAGANDHYLRSIRQIFFTSI